MKNCPDCGCPDLYKEKNFPKPLGLFILIVGIVTSFWTYGLSLIGIAIIDGLIYLIVPDQLVCYRCRRVYRDIPIPKDRKGFDHHQAELYRIV